MKRVLGATSFPALARHIFEKHSGHIHWKNQLLHVQQLGDPDYLASYENSIGVAVTGELRGGWRKDRTLLDFGCWSGITSLYLQELTGLRVIGSDISSSCVEFAEEIIKPYAGSGALEFTKTSPSEIPIPDASVDIAVVNQVFCNMYAPQIPVMLKELARVLRKNGRLILVDSNNPRNSEVINRLLALYKQLEGKEGSYFRARREVIDEMVPETAPNDELAMASCYMTRNEIVDLIRDGSFSPESNFVPDSLRPPVSMGAPVGAPSSVTDPRVLVNMLEQSDLNCLVGSSYPPDGLLTDEASFYIVGRKG